MSWFCAFSVSSDAGSLPMNGVMLWTAVSNSDGPA